LYYVNLLQIFDTLSEQNFKTIHGYANVDALIFNSIVNIDYISIGTYEVQRSFNISRYVEDNSGGGSKGWYYSEKLLSFIRAQELELIRREGGLSLIENEDNIFSDLILVEDYDWNIHKPAVHKNYLVSVSKMLKEIHETKNPKEKIELMLEKVKKAREIFSSLESNNIFLSPESSGMHLPYWQTILSKNLNR
jgi:hypothetical protein